MNNEEAKQRLESFKPFLADDAWKECYELATNALEKQIPQKPKPSGKYGVCPSCSKLIERYEQKHGNIEIPHCKWCGQAVDWSET